MMGLSIKAAAADVNHLGGALIAVMAVISMGEVVRTCRYLNVLFGLAVAIWPWFLSDSNLALNISSAVSGLLVAGLFIPRGTVKESYGLWDKYVR